MAETAGTLNCLMCGAATRSDATHCEHCGARLATVSCPSCFGMIFQGSKFCSHCGAAVSRQENDVSGFLCPHCETPLRYLRIGKVELAECEKCDGLWLENSQFETVCADREQQAALLGTAVPISTTVPIKPVKYVKCPVCQTLMHRQNFSGASGVVIDVCKAHGTWFDAEELQRIIAFIRGGGLERAREKQKRELEEARRSLEAERARVRTAANADYNRPQGTGHLAGDIIVALAEAVWSVTGRKRF
jgi:Zn-finger nucleic acid-binding protein